MQAKDIMTTNVATVTPDTSVNDVAKLLIEKSISGAPVTNADGTLVGVVSEGDLLRRPELETERHSSWWLDLLANNRETAAEYVKSHGTKAADVMTRNVVSVSETATVGEIAATLEKHRIKRVPVVRDGKVVGIVSRANLLHGLAARKEPSAATPSADDRTIREKLTEQLESQGWVSSGSLNLIVDGGIVQLWGWVDSEEERRAIVLAAEQYPGVKGVEDHLGSLPPYLRSA